MFGSINTSPILIEMNTSDNSYWEELLDCDEDDCDRKKELILELYLIYIS